MFSEIKSPVIDKAVTHFQAVYSYSPVLWFTTDGQKKHLLRLHPCHQRLLGEIVHNHGGKVTAGASKQSFWVVPSDAPLAIPGTPVDESKLAWNLSLQPFNDCKQTLFAMAETMQPRMLFDGWQRWSDRFHTALRASQNDLVLGVQFHRPPSVPMDTSTDDMVVAAAKADFCSATLVLHFHREQRIGLERIKTYQDKDDEGRPLPQQRDADKLHRVFVGDASDFIVKT